MNITPYAFYDAVIEMIKKAIMVKRITVLLPVFLLLLLSACSHLPVGLESPRLRVLDIQILDGKGLAPAIGIKLNVANPNSVDLNIVGAAYSVEIEGVELLHGVANDIPKIGAYQSQEITLKTQASMVQGARLLNKLMQKSSNTIAYKMVLKLDASASLWPIRIEDGGEINLQSMP